MPRSTVARNQAAALSKFQDHFARACFFKRRKRAPRVVRAGEQRGLVRAEKEDIDARNDLQNFSGNLLGRRHSYVERNPTAASMNFAGNLFGGVRGAGIEEIVADEMRCCGFLAKRAQVA